MSTARENAIQTFSNDQSKILSLIPLPPALLSILGSTCIIASIRRSKKRKGTYERIMLIMSVYDMLFTIVLVISPFLTYSDKWWRSFGTPQTCNLIGTLFQMSLSNMMYYGALSFYFLLTIRFHMTQDTIAKRIEPWTHGVCILWPLVTSLVGAFLNWYDELEVRQNCQ